MRHVLPGDDGAPRCWWCVNDALLQSYHDDEWGRPVGDDIRLFEKLSLEGFQAGLSWLTILKKRDNFRHAFKSFSIDAVARFNARSVDRLLSDAGIVRNRAKIEATINNARRCGELVQEYGSLAAYVWGFEGDANAMSKDLRRRGWAFVGPTTVYSFMEAMGLFNNHVEGCIYRDEVERERMRFKRP